MLEVPNGYGQLVRTFGDPRPFIRDKTIWEADILRIRPLPAPIPYAYLPDVKITRVRAHLLVVGLIVEAIEECLDLGVTPDRLTYGGCYSFRPMRRHPRLSTHSWGIAIDLDPLRNQRGTDGNMAPEILDAFTKRGFQWGGFWKDPDPMHYQYCRGY